MEARRREDPRGWFLRKELLPGSTGLKIGLTLLAGVVWVLPWAARQPRRAEDELLAQDLGNPSSPLNNRPMPPPQYPNLAGMPTVNNTNPPFTAAQLELMNEVRQKSMVADADKLLKLAKELNAEVSGTHAGALTEDQLLEVKEIEKLAHKVRDEMSFVVGREPNMGPSLVGPRFP